MRSEDTEEREGNYTARSGRRQEQWAKFSCEPGETFHSQLVRRKVLSCVQSEAGLLVKGWSSGNASQKISFCLEMAFSAMGIRMEKESGLGLEENDGSLD